MRSLVQILIHWDMKNSFTLNYPGGFKTFHGSPEGFAKFLRRIGAKESSSYPRSARFKTYMEIVKSIMDGKDPTVYCWSNILAGIPERVINEENIIEKDKIMKIKEDIDIGDIVQYKDKEFEVVDFDGTEKIVVQDPDDSSTKKTIYIADLYENVKRIKEEKQYKIIDIAWKDEITNTSYATFDELLKIADVWKNEGYKDTDIEEVEHGVIDGKGKLIAIEESKIKKSVKKIKEGKNLSGFFSRREIRSKLMHDYEDNENITLNIGDKVYKGTVKKVRDDLFKEPENDEDDQKRINLLVESKIKEESALYKQGFEDYRNNIIDKQLKDDFDYMRGQEDAEKDEKGELKESIKESIKEKYKIKCAGD